MGKRDFLSFDDLTIAECQGLLDLALRMKSGDYTARPLAGQTLALIFAKSSTRTRVSFEVGARQLGADALFLSSRDIQLGRGEPIKDTARVLSRYLDGIMIRTFAQRDVEELAHFADIPIINGLTDLLHPCQLLADLLTVQEEFGSLHHRIVAWIGDGNNMANSWIEAAGLFGFELRLACPEGYEPDHAIFDSSSKRTRLLITDDPDEAVAGASVVNTDVWASMGQESEAAARQQAFEGYCVNDQLLALAAPDAIVLHCLPAHRGEEITEAVLEGPRSRVWNEAENRLHAQKALMVMLMGREAEAHGPRPNVQSPKPEAQSPKSRP
ncbi:MAG: ornithine carbamoyltransferase [Gemmatimonadales bacterium]